MELSQEQLAEIKQFVQGKGFVLNDGLRDIRKQRSPEEISIPELVLIAIFISK